MAPRTLRKVFPVIHTLSSDKQAEPFLPVFATPAPGPVDPTALGQDNMKKVYHFAHSKHCTAKILLTIHGKPDPRAYTDLCYKDIATLGPRTQLCPDCFGGPGCTQVLHWINSTQASQTARQIAFHVTMTNTLHRIRRQRKGTLSHTAYALREAAGTRAKIAEVTKQASTLTEEQRDWHGTLLPTFEDSAELLLAIINPGQSSYVVNKLRDTYTTNGREWVILDETPTLLAIEHDMYLPSWQQYGPELFSSMKISDPTHHGSVMYGPRFAIDYLQRLMNGSPHTYVIATAVEDPEVAKIAAGLWDISGQGGIRDIFDAITTARTMITTPQTQDHVLTSA
jgi:hypothetical protein